jgi:hypothetical protein
MNNVDIGGREINKLNKRQQVTVRSMSKVTINIQANVMHYNTLQYFLDLFFQ